MLLQNIKKQLNEQLPTINIYNLRLNVYVIYYRKIKTLLKYTK